MLCITDSGTMGAIWNSRSVVAMAGKRRPRRRRGWLDGGDAGWFVVLVLVVFLLLGTELEPPSDPDESGIQPAWLSQGASSPSFADGPRGRVVRERGGSGGARGSRTQWAIDVSLNPKVRADWRLTPSAPWLTGPGSWSRAALTASAAMAAMAIPFSPGQRRPRPWQRSNWANCFSWEGGRLGF